MIEIQEIKPMYEKYDIDPTAELNFWDNHHEDEEDEAEVECLN